MFLIKGADRFIARLWDKFRGTKMKKPGESSLFPAPEEAKDDPSFKFTFREFVRLERNNMVEYFFCCC